jgi:hypothetical protein
VRVLCSEGVATHTGPEPCVVVRKDGGEASAGERIGQPLSRERNLIPGADAVVRAEGNTDGHDRRERPDGPAWSETLACADAPCAGTGRSRDRPFGKSRRSASGRRGAVADEAGHRTGQTVSQTLERIR